MNEPSADKYEDDLTEPSSPSTRPEAAALGQSTPLEIEGQVTFMGTVGATVLDDEPSVPDPMLDETTFAVHQDPMMVLSLENPALTVTPGASVMLHVQLLNNGDRTGLFELLIEGWIDSDWIEINPIYRELKPGERAAIATEICPPRSSSSQAGRRQIVAVMRSPDYPNRESRQAATLTISPYDDVWVGDIKPFTVHAMQGQRTAFFNVPVTNQGNRAAQVRVQGQAGQSDLRLRQLDDGQKPWTPHQAEEALVDLAPGQSLAISGSIQPRRLPLLRSRRDQYRILASVVGKQQVPRAASGLLISHPLLGARQLRLAAALLALALLAVVILGVTGLGLKQLVANLPAGADPTISSPPPQAPAIALIVPVDDPVPTPNGTSAAASAAAPIVVTVGDGAGSDDGAVGREASVPLVQAGEISAPGAAGGAPPAAVAAPAVAPPPSGQPALTYAQMFQEIALRYDLDWRLLAAQAYVESRFDTLALGADGDLGLMQVLPRTWQEWAPAVEVNDPFDAYSNVLVAAIYLDYLRARLGEQGHPESEWMLVAYNWGPDKVATFLADGNTWDDLPESLQRYATEISRIADSLPQ